MFDLAQKLVGNDRLVVDANARTPQEGRFLAHEGVYFRGTFLKVIFLAGFSLHLLLLAGLLQAVLNPAEEDEVELPDVLLVPHRQVVAVVVDDGGDDQCGVHVLTVRGDESAEEVLEVLHQPAAGQLALELHVRLHVPLDVLVLDVTVLFGQLVAQHGPHEAGVLKVGLQEGVEVAGWVGQTILFPIFLSPTGTPDLRTRCSGFSGSKP
jgi:hypothetical protein